MKRTISILAAAVTLGAALASASPVQAAAPVAAQDWRCTYGSHSTNPPTGNPRTNWVIGQRSNGSGVFGVTRRYWLTEIVYFNSGGSYNRFESVSYATCGVFGSTVYTLTPVAASGQAPCTAPGEYSEVAGGKIITHRYAGSRASVTGVFFPASYTYRFWHSEEQTSPGVWSWTASSVARC
ncbi:hypothetical protein [Longispora albida]|uniref:hypothetical protein n=1 Tax=Longispora albida TaxID=203523 RepID=UPI0003822318|nr:hypothetical protein [Longispora albida]